MAIVGGGQTGFDMTQPADIMHLAGWCIIVLLILGEGGYPVLADSLPGPGIGNESAGSLYRAVIQSPGTLPVLSFSMKPVSIPHGKNTSDNEKTPPIVLEPIYPGGDGYSCNCSHSPGSSLPWCTGPPAYTIFSSGSYIVGADSKNQNCSIWIQAEDVALDGNGQTCSGVTISPGASGTTVSNFGAISEDGLNSFADNTTITNNSVIQVNNQGISIYGSECVITGNTVNNNHIVILGSSNIV